MIHLLPIIWFHNYPSSSIKFQQALSRNIELATTDKCLYNSTWILFIGNIPLLIRDKHTIITSIRWLPHTQLLPPLHINIISVPPSLCVPQNMNLRHKCSQHSTSYLRQTCSISSDNGAVDESGDLCITYLLRGHRVTVNRTWVFSCGQMQTECSKEHPPPPTHFGRFIKVKPFPSVLIYQLKPTSAVNDWPIFQRLQ